LVNTHSLQRREEGREGRKEGGRSEGRKGLREERTGRKKRGRK
jgi:hypothetical protein